MDLYHSITSCGLETALPEDTDSAHMPELQRTFISTALNFARETKVTTCNISYHSAMNFHRLHPKSLLYLTHTDS